MTGMLPPGFRIQRETNTEEFFINMGPQHPSTHGALRLALRMDGETVMVTPAASFYRTPGMGTHQVRIAYVLEVPELRKAMKVLAAALEAYPGRTI